MHNVLFLREQLRRKEKKGCNDSIHGGCGKVYLCYLNGGNCGFLNRQNGWVARPHLLFDGAVLQKAPWTAILFVHELILIHESGLPSVIFNRTSARRTDSLIHILHTALHSICHRSADFHNSTARGLKLITIHWTESYPKNYSYSVEKRLLRRLVDHLAPCHCRESIIWIAWRHWLTWRGHWIGIFELIALHFCSEQAIVYLSCNSRKVDPLLAALTFFPLCH